LQPFANNRLAKNHEILKNLCAALAQLGMTLMGKQQQPRLRTQPFKLSQGLDSSVWDSGNNNLGFGPNPSRSATMTRLTSRLALALTLVLASAGLANAQSYDVQNRVTAILQDPGYAQQCLNWIHTGCKSRGATIQEITGVIDQFGNAIPNYFAVNVRYHWTDLLGKQGTSDLVLFFDGNGRFQSFKNGHTTAILLTHFSEAKLLKAAAKVVLPLVNNPEWRQTLERLLDNADIERAYATKLVVDFP
jgi:hypothetical protein